MRKRNGSDCIFRRGGAEPQTIVSKVPRVALLKSTFGPHGHGCLSTRDCVQGGDLQVVRGGPQPDSVLPSSIATNRHLNFVLPRGGDVRRWLLQEVNDGDMFACKELRKFTGGNGICHLKKNRKCVRMESGRLQQCD